MAAKKLISTPETKYGHFLHDIMHAVSSSLHLASEAADDFTNFCIAEAEVTLTIDIGFKADENTEAKGQKVDGSQPKSWISNETDSSSEISSRNKAKIRMVFKPASPQHQGEADDFIQGETESDDEWSDETESNDEEW